VKGGVGRAMLGAVAAMALAGHCQLVGPGSLKGAGKTAGRHSSNDETANLVLVASPSTTRR
jgi:hypothetical protein